MHLVFCVYSCAPFTLGLANPFLSMKVVQALMRNTWKGNFFLSCAFAFFVAVQYHAS